MKVGVKYRFSNFFPFLSVLAVIFSYATGMLIPSHAMKKSLAILC